MKGKDMKISHTEILGKFFIANKLFTNSYLLEHFIVYTQFCYDKAGICILFLMMSNYFKGSQFKTQFHWEQ